MILQDFYKFGSPILLHQANDEIEALRNKKRGVSGITADDSDANARGVNTFMRDPATNGGSVPSSLPDIETASPVIVLSSAVNSIFTDGSREAKLIGDLDKISHLRCWLSQVHKRAFEPEVAALRADLAAWPARREKLTLMVERVRRAIDDPACAAYKDQIDAFLNA